MYVWMSLCACVCVGRYVCVWPSDFVRDNVNGCGADRGSLSILSLQFFSWHAGVKGYYRFPNVSGMYVRDLILLERLFLHYTKHSKHVDSGKGMCECILNMTSMLLRCVLCAPHA
jgi:hypothetical protein